MVLSRVDVSTHCYDFWNQMLISYQLLRRYQERHSASRLHFSIPTAGLLKVEEDSKYSMTDGDLLIELSVIAQWLSDNFMSMSDIELQTYFACEAKDTVRDQIIDSDSFGVRSSLIGFFSTFQSCQNSVLADRISIIGNACMLPWRLLSNRLNRAEFSYSTCIFALLLANRFPLADDWRKAIYAANSFTDWFDCSLIVCIGYWGFQEINEH
jgi:hypothetical protein